MVAPTQGRSVPPTAGKRRALLVDPVRRRKHDPHLRSRLLISLIIVVFAAIIASVILTDLEGESTSQLYSPGPLCQTHVKANAKCFDCHVTGSPMREDAEGGSVAPDEKWGRATDLKCRNCHPVVPLDTATPNLKSVGHHTSNEHDGKVRACAACHREHRGADADLTEVAVHFCTHCHSDLTEFAKDVSQVASKNALKITGFDTGHPDFPSLAAYNGVDPGMVKFTHQRHTTAGLVKPHESAEAKMHWSELSFEQRNLLGGPDSPGDNDLVKLDCATCHEPDTNSDGSVGRNMKPPNFDRHCKVCHPVAPAAYEDALAVSKHAELTPSLIHSRLEKLIHSTSRDIPVEVLDVEDVKRLSEGRPQLPRPVELQWPRAEIVLTSNPEEELKQAKSELRRICFQCHYPIDQPGEPVPLPGVEPSNIRSQKKNEPWLTGAQFDHRTHDTYDIQCSVCHFGKEKSPEGSGILMSTNHKDILIPNRQVCLKCHTSETNDADETSRRGGTNCLLCHVYHKQGRDQPRVTQ